MPSCKKCGDAVYIGSRLPEDAYVEKDGAYVHVTCPRPPVMNFNKGTADGLCNYCGGKVPSDNLNRFYCSSGCMAEAYAYQHPSEDNED